MYYCNYFFAIIFTLEFLIKLFALGFVTYFTNFWNLLDVFIVAVSPFIVITSIFFLSSFAFIVLKLTYQ